MGESSYRVHARFLIQAVITQRLGFPARKPTEQEAKELKRAIAAARPCDWHSGWAYQQWLKERRAALVQLGIPVRGKLHSRPAIPSAPGQITLDF
jgi:hypothetical protein